VSAIRRKYCGGDLRLNLHSFAQTAPPAVPSAYNGFKTQGCYTEASHGRALVGASFFDDAMTLEKCSAVCAGFSYFGVEYGRECYCGDVVAEWERGYCRGGVYLPMPGRQDAKVWCGE
jgi:hypothetical protein